MNKRNGYDMNKIPTHCRRFHAASFQLILLALQSASVRAVLRVGPMQKSFQGGFGTEETANKGCCQYEVCQSQFLASASLHGRNLS